MSATPDTDAIDLEEMAEWLAGRRWFGSKTRELTQVGVIDMPLLDPGPPQLRIALVEATFGTGAHELYQVPIVIDGDSLPPEARIAGLGDGTAAYDLLAERRDPPRLLELIAAGGQVASAEGRVVFAWADAGPPPPPDSEVRPISSEQSNSSVVFGENAILKIYRRVEAGVNPELEMLRFLNLHGFRRIPRLLGWYEYEGRPADATLGVVQEFIPDGRDGWAWTLDGLAGDPDSLLEPLRALGATVGAMHTALASDPTDPVFAPEERGNESLALFVASLDEQIERVFLDLPDDARLGPIVHRGEELRDQLRGLAMIGGIGMAIRVHADLHLGQTLLSDRGWTILDFEGEPARPLPERRTKHSPLRDVAGLLRSVAYAPPAARLQRSAMPPADWEARARERFLDGYLDSIDPTLLPATRREVDQLLAIYELEKAVYELNYELNNRPDWVEIPVAGITRLLEVEVG
ncbi:MAG TPA: phosphotransferase [Solirubrobacterales bacterium]|nr:phosphotransferase [Solirubrobacterales bacterium]